MKQKQYILQDDLALFSIDEKAPSFYRLIAAKIYQKNELLIDLKMAEALPSPDYTSIDLGDKHVHHPFGRYINHSCNPTAYIDIEQKRVVALKSINPGDEITFNYLVSERQIVAPFDCNCGAENCIGRVEKSLREDYA